MSSPDPSPPRWHLAHGRSLALNAPRIIAVLNATPDSFHDGGRRADPAAAADAAAAFLAEGADAIDIGGESTRPGAQRIPAAEQLRRVVPVVRAVRAAAPHLPLSIDTTLAEVAAAALDEGADAINDVSAGREDPAILTLAAERGAGLILMHRLAPPEQDSYSDRYTQAPWYSGVVADVRTFLEERAGAAERAGVPRDRIALDPGLGFGKSVDQNLALIAGTAEIAALGPPVVSALSRKSFVGRVGLGRDTDPAERLAPTIALSVAHFLRGARLFRVHDVAAHAAALRVAHTLAARGGGA